MNKTMKIFLILVFIFSFFYTVSAQTCSSTDVAKCFTKTECTNAGGLWCNNTCGNDQKWYNSCIIQYPETPTCNSSETYVSSTNKCVTTSCFNNIEVCNSQSMCERKGSYWCSSTASCVPELQYCNQYSVKNCHLSNKGNCYTKDGCEQKTGIWCQLSATYGTCVNDNSLCGIDCSKNASNCFNKTDCESKGHQWNDNQCIPACNSSGYLNCKTENTCANQGGKWCSQSSICYADSNKSACPTAPTNVTPTPVTECKSTDIAKCFTKTECQNVGGLWCNNTCGNDQKWYDACLKKDVNAEQPPKEAVPKCSKTDVTKCFTKNECQAVEGLWCNNTCGNDIKWYNACIEKEQPKNCNDSDVAKCLTKNECESVRGLWCDNVCGNDQKWYNECIGKVPPSRDVNEPLDEAKFPSEEKLLNTVVKLETLNISLNKTKLTLQGIAIYWKSVGKSERFEKFNKAALVVESVQEKIELVRKKLGENRQNLNEKTLNEVKEELKQVKKSMTELIDILLGE